MDVRHDDDDVASAESDPEYRGGLDRKLVRSLRKKMLIIRGVKNETELYRWKGLHFEKLKGDRSHQHSIRLNKKWRLIMEFEIRNGENNNLCVVKELDDYHK